MHRRIPCVVRYLLLLITAPALLAAQALPSIADKTKGLEKRDGLFPLYWDGAAGKLWLEIPRLETEVLYVVSLPRGMGSNDIGLDRGQLGQERVVLFRRVGPKVLLVQPNYEFRATTQNPEEVRAVRDAFARSVLWGFPVAAESGGRVLVDATDWIVRDSLNLAPRLRPGSYKLDEKRSSLYRAGIFNFPKNTELEAELSYVLQQPSGPPQGGAAPGPGSDFAGGRFLEGVGDVAASAEAASVRVHHSFIELPEPGNVGSLRFSPDGTTLLTRWSDGISLTDVVSGKTESFRSPEADTSTEVAFAEGSVFWQLGNTVHVWSLAERTHAELPLGACRLAAVSRSGARLAAACENDVTLWSLPGRGQGRPRRLSNIS